MDLYQQLSDSLKTLETAEGVEKVDLLNLLSGHFAETNSKLAIQYAESSKKLSEELGDEERLAKSFLLLGDASFHDNDILTSIERFASAAILFEKTGNTGCLIETLIKMGISQNALGDFSRALSSYFKALKLCKNTEDLQNESRALKNIGISYFYNSENRSALEYLNQSYQICSSIGDKKELADVMLAMAGVYVSMGNPEKVIEYYTKCRTIYEELNSPLDLARIYHNLGVIFLAMGKIDDARESANIALETFIKLDKKTKICKSLIVIGQAYAMKKEYENALSYFDKAIPIAEEYDNKSILETLYCEKSDIAAAKDDYRSAYDLYVKYHELVNKRLRETSEVQTKYLSIAHKVDTLKKESDTLAAKNTQLNQMNAQLNQMNEQLNLKNNSLHDTLTALHLQSNEIKRINNINTKLLSILAHDLKNPLWALKQAMELHSEESLDPQETQEVFKTLCANADTTLNMLDEVLHWGTSQVEHKKTMDFVDINLYELIERKRTDYSLLLASKNNQLKNVCGQNFTFKADVNMLNFILRNLIMNANKFTSNGTISVHAINQSDSVEIIISDTGKGMEPYQIDRLFNWETRQSSVGTSGEKGTGLGLLICTEFVINHQGKIWVKSEPEKGSDFHFTISKKLQ